jgi:hypothetical protein
MADTNPTRDPRAVSIHLPTAQTAILCDELIGWLAGIEEDLAADRTPPNPEESVREADAFRRLLVALDRGMIELPDEEARSALERAAVGYDAASGHGRVRAVHDAHHALLSLLG